MSLIRVWRKIRGSFTSQPHVLKNYLFLLVRKVRRSDLLIIFHPVAQLSKSPIYRILGKTKCRSASVKFGMGRNDPKRVMIQYTVLDHYFVQEFEMIIARLISRAKY